MAYHGSGHYRRSLQDVDALGLFHHGRGIGRHVGNLDDVRRSVSQMINDDLQGVPSDLGLGVALTLMLPLLA